MDHRAEINIILDAIDDAGALEYIAAFLRLYAEKYGFTGGRASDPSCSQ